MEEDDKYGPSDFLYALFGPSKYLRHKKSGGSTYFKRYKELRKEEKVFRQEREMPNCLARFDRIEERVDLLFNYVMNTEQIDN